MLEATAKAEREKALAEEIKRLRTEMKAMEKDIHDRILELQLNVRAIELLLLSEK